VERIEICRSEKINRLLFELLLSAARPLLAAGTSVVTKMVLLTPFNVFGFFLLLLRAAQHMIFWISTGYKLWVWTLSVNITYY
jgi:hypothetical protein